LFILTLGYYGSAALWNKRVSKIKRKWTWRHRNSQFGLKRDRTNWEEGCEINW